MLCCHGVVLPWGPYYSKSVAKPTCYLTQSTLSAQSSSKTKLRALRELGVKYIREFCNYLRSSDVPASLCARLRVSNSGMPPEASPTKSHRPTIPSLLTQPQQFMEWDNCIKISVSFDYWRQMPVVNERRADRHVRSRLKTAHFCINLFNDVTSYLVFSLYFNYVGSSPRLDQKVYLASALAKRRDGQLAIRSRRGQKDILQVKIWNQRPIVVNSTIFRF